MRNWLANYGIYIVDRNSFKDKIYSESETTLGSFIFYAFFAMLITIVFIWWIFPLIYIYDKLLPILNHKYKCDKV